MPRRLTLFFSTILLAFTTVATAQENSFLDDVAVREALVGNTLKGKDWIEFYLVDGNLIGKVRYFGVHSYTGKWDTTNGKVCYQYSDPRANTCSWLRLNGDRVTHHSIDGKLKKDGDALRLVGNQLDSF